MAKIHEELAELEDQLKELEGKEDESPAEEVEKQVEEESKEPEKQEDPKEEAKGEEKEDKTDADYRRERRERKAREDELARKVAELEERLAAKEKPAEKVTDPEPDRANNYEEWLEWSLRQTNQRLEQVSSTVHQQTQQVQKQQLMTSAAQELKQHIDAFKAKAPDWDDVSDFAEKELARSLRITQGLSGKALQDAINTKVLSIAATAARDGEDPAAALYNWAKQDLGYKPQPKEDKKEIKPDLDKLGDNKKRSAGTAGASGSSKPEMTLEYMANLKPKDVKKLSKEDQARYFAQ